MIRLTHLDGEPFILNAELIRYVEARPDTFITIISGERVIVRETMDEVLERAVAYQQTKYLLPPPALSGARQSAQIPNSPSQPPRARPTHT
ncbi:MAG: flagellar FlbD family protein [Pirellulaceae bacterium]